MHSTHLIIKLHSVTFYSFVQSLEEWRNNPRGSSGHVRVCSGHIYTIPSIRELATVDIKYTWYADDASAGGSITDLWRWWSGLKQHGPGYGYFPNPRKTIFLVEEEHFMRASQELILRYGCCSHTWWHKCVRKSNWKWVLCIISSVIQSLIWAGPLKSNSYRYCSNLTLSCFQCFLSYIYMYICTVYLANGPTFSRQLQ